MIRYGQRSFDVSLSSGSDMVLNQDKVLNQAWGCFSFNAVMAQKTYPTLLYFRLHSSVCFPKKKVCRSSIDITSPQHMPQQHVCPKNASYFRVRLVTDPCVCAAVLRLIRLERGIERFDRPALVNLLLIFYSFE